MKVKPLPISKITVRKSFEIPELVILTINGMLKDHWDGQQAVLHTKDILKNVSLIFNKPENEVLQSHWLDIEPHYRKAGYNVEYFKPPFGQVGNAFFKFSKPND